MGRSARWMFASTPQCKTRRNAREPATLTRCPQTPMSQHGYLAGCACGRSREPCDWAVWPTSIMRSESSRKVRLCAAAHPPQVECTQVVGRFRTWLHWPLKLRPFADAASRGCCWPIVSVEQHPRPPEVPLLPLDRSQEAALLQQQPSQSRLQLHLMLQPMRLAVGAAQQPQLGRRAGPARPTTNCLSLPPPGRPPGASEGTKKVRRRPQPSNSMPFASRALC